MIFTFHRDKPGGAVNRVLRPLVTILCARRGKPIGNHLVCPPGQARRGSSSSTRCGKQGYFKTAMVETAPRRACPGGGDDGYHGKQFMQRRPIGLAPMERKVTTTFMTRPNLLVFFTDQQRADSIGCYGQALPTTPVLDKMAAGGVRFANAYTPNPVCGPARSSLQTGCYPTTTGTHTNGIHLPEDADTIARRLAKAGYSTGYIGKWHLASSNATGLDNYATRPVPEARRGGYEDQWLAADVLEFTSHGYGGYLFDKDNNKVEFGEDTHRIDFMTDRLLDTIDRMAADERPFFLTASYLEPHHQNDRDDYEPPQGMEKPFLDADLPGDLGALGGNAQEHWADYLGCVAALDEALGKVLAKLGELGIADNTLVVFISDHGCHFRTRNAEYKRSCHDASIHIPLVLRGPGFTGGKVENCIASLLDVVPTLLTAAGEPVPGHLHGRPLQESGAPDWRRDHLSQISESQVGRCLRTDRWTYSVRVPGEPWVGRRERPPMNAHVYREDILYDNQADPDQLDNRIADPQLAEIRADLRARLLAQLSAAGEPPARIEPAPA